MANFDARLKKAKTAWTTARTSVKESSGGFMEYEDGKYLARCTNLELGESQNGRFQAVFTWVFEEGDYEKKEKKAFQGLESEDGFRFFGRDLDRLGYELPEELTTASIDAIAKDIRKTRPLARIVLKTKGDFQNVYINKLLAGRDSDDEEEVEDMTGASAEEVEEEEAETADVAEEVEEEAEEVEEEEEEEVEEEEETVDIAVGMKVIVNAKDGDVLGEVIEVLVDEGKVRVKTVTGKTLKVGVDKIEVQAEEVAEAPKPAPAKKAAPAPAKKAAPVPAPVAKKGKK